MPTLAILPSLALALLVASRAPQHRPIAWLVGLALAIDGARWLTTNVYADMGLALLLPIASGVVYWRVFR